jgi:quinoprotein glucose dehydrogenase|tara:strand:+ start:21851 stop:23764 length:1914 start_codon:yes stop_codon:yes gene_type:complete
MGKYFLCILTLTAAIDTQAEEIEWPAYGGAPGGGHYTSATQIDKSNVERLVQAWTHRSGDYRVGTSLLTEGGRGNPSSSFMVTPIMVKDTLYYCTPFNRVFALDPATGKERWVFDPQVDMDKELLTNCRGVSSWSDADVTDGECGHRIYLGTHDARLIALDADTGKKCPDFAGGGELDLTEGLTDHGPGDYGVTSAPAIIGDLIVTGAFVTDSLRPDVPAGVVRAYNIRTGDFVWGWNPVHPDHQPQDSDGKYVAGTTNVWSTISVDAERGLVIVPTGNSSPDYYGGDRGGHLDYYSSSVVALDAANGEVVWHYQTVHHDIWDYDVPAQPTLVDLTIGGQTRPAVVQVTKMGLTFVLDRETGEPLHPIEERPVPQDGAVPGEYLSPTQPIPLKPDPLHQLGLSPDDAWGLTFWDKGKCREYLESVTTGPIYTPPSSKGTTFFPSNLGGNNWGAPAVDPNRKIMIANTKHIAMEVKLTEQKDCPAGLPMPQKGSPYCVIMKPVISPWGVPCTAPPWSTLAAVDLESGDTLWKVPLGTLEGLAPWPFYHFIESSIEMGGPMITASGLVFIAATSDSYIQAYDIDTGAQLWRDKLPTTGNAVPMSYVYRDEQYVVIAAGGHFVSPMPPGDYVIAFKLESD